MNRYGACILAFAAAIFPAVAVGASNAMSMSAVGAGPAGYDYLVGTWSCKNTMAASKLGALPSSSLTATKLKDGSILIRTASPNGDVTAYNTYLPSSKTWFSPYADSGGYYGYESTQQSGKSIRWTGIFYSPSGGATPICDTYTMLAMTKQYDLSEAKVGGSWKVTARTTCTKS